MKTLSKQVSLAIIALLLYLPNISYSQAQKKQVKQTPITCSFANARIKALDKIKRLDLYYVGDLEAGHSLNYNNCTGTFHFYVKRVLYKFDGKSLSYTNESYIDDKIYRLNIAYQKIGSSFEYSGANLYDQHRGTVQRLD